MKRTLSTFKSILKDIATSEIFLKGILVILLICAFGVMYHLIESIIFVLS